MRSAPSPLQLQEALGIGTAQIGLLVTASALVGALAAIPFGLLVDKSRRVDLLTVSILLWATAEVLSAFSTSYGMLLLRAAAPRRGDGDGGAGRGLAHR